MERLRAWAGRCRGAFAERLGSADLFRAGLVSATVVAALGLIAAAFLYAPHAPESPTPGERVAAAAPAPTPLSRLPRPRPDVPATTGSIRPAAAEAPSPPIAASGRRLAELQTRAVLIASSWSECDQVDGAEPFELQGAAEGEILIRIRCGNGTRFVLGESDIEANRIVSRAPEPAGAAAPQTPTLAALAARSVPTIGEPPPAPSAPSDAEIVRACEDKVRQGLPFPDSLNRALATTGISRMSDDAVVTFDFDALNGFGFPLLFRVECVFDDRELARLELSPR